MESTGGILGDVRKLHLETQVSPFITREGNAPGLVVNVRTDAGTNG